jgi:hypothetical protein
MLDCALALGIWAEMEFLYSTFSLVTAISGSVISGAFGWHGSLTFVLSTQIAGKLFSWRETKDGSMHSSSTRGACLEARMGSSNRISWHLDTLIRASTRSYHRLTVRNSFKLCGLSI